MTPAPAATNPAWSDACLAVRLFAADPTHLGGISLRARAGPVRDGLIAQLPNPASRLPAQLSDQALHGGLDLAATLSAGHRSESRGLLASHAGRILLAPMAERMSPPIAARLAAALDTACITGLIALDEGRDDDEHTPSALLDRLAFHVDLTTVSHRDALPPAPEIARLPGALGKIELADELLTALCTTAAALGVHSPRAVLFAVRAARTSAHLAGRTQATAEDAAIAARLVLSPRATIYPAETADEQQSEQTQANAPPDPPDREQDSNDDATRTAPEDAVIILQAARAAIPAGLLATPQGPAPRTAARDSGASGQLRRGTLHGRPAGVRAGSPGGGLRLHLLETLRAAAPWQRLRAPDQPGPFPLHIRRADFRIVRTVQRARSTTLFLVDASGSSAFNRLAEAKGAVELLLAECYRRRDEVAVIAFRGTSAQTLLPPTRSLVRAKRSLATLPGGGGTPLAAGIDAGCTLALTIGRTGATPTLVLLTDGRANVTRAGTGGRKQAATEALQSARLLHAFRIASLLIDTSPRPAPEAASIARAMGARYLPLPYADAAGLSRAIRAQT